MANLLYMGTGMMVQRHSLFTSLLAYVSSFITKSSNLGKVKVQRSKIKSGAGGESQQYWGEKFNLTVQYFNLVFLYLPIITKNPATHIWNYENQEQLSLCGGNNWNNWIFPTVSYRKRTDVQFSRNNIYMKIFFRINIYWIWSLNLMLKGILNLAQNVLCFFKSSIEFNNALHEGHEIPLI